MDNCLFDNLREQFERIFGGKVLNSVSFESMLREDCRDFEKADKDDNCEGKGILSDAISCSLFYVRVGRNHNWIQMDLIIRQFASINIESLDSVDLIESILSSHAMSINNVLHYYIEQVEPEFGIRCHVRVHLEVSRD